MRNVSAALKKAVYSSETGEAFIILLEITSPEITDPIRVTSDAVDTNHQGNNYVRFPFQVTLHDENEDQVPRVRLTIDGVDQRVAEAVRRLTEPPDVTQKVVLSSDPDTVELGPITFKLRNITVKKRTVTGQLTKKDILNAPFPSGTFNPIDFPGLF